MRATRALVVPFIFLATGVTNTLFQQMLTYEGAAHKLSLLAVWINYAGVLLSGLAFSKVAVTPVSRASASASAASAGKVTPVVVMPPAVSAEQQTVTLRVSDDGDDDEDALTCPTPTAVKAPSTTSSSEVERLQASPVREGKRLQRMLVLVSFVDMIANALSLYALQVAGSGTYQVCYSSILVSTAVFSHVFLGKSRSAAQWLSIVVITCGLGLSALGANTSAAEAARSMLVDVEDVDGGDELEVTPRGAPKASSLYGIGLTIFTTMIYAIIYIMFEQILSGPRPIPKAQVSRTVGTYGLAISSLYVVAYTLPRWDELVTQPIADAGGTAHMALFWYAMLLLSVAGHNATYYMLMSSAGAVTAGVIQALRAVAVFGTSALAFCSVQESQCFTPNKALSSFVVVLGILLYAVASDQRAKKDVRKQ